MRAGVVLAAAVLLAGCSSSTVDVTDSAGTPAPPSGAPTVGSAESVETAPACEGFPPDIGRGLPCLGPGEPVDIATLPGPTLVSVWASWCQPCREELPVLQQWHQSGGSVLGVDVADDSASAAALLAELGVTFPSVQDPDSTTRIDIGWVGPPANVIIVDGQIVYRFNQEITSVSQIRRAVAQAEGA